MSWKNFLQTGALPDYAKAQLQKNGLQLLSENVRVTIIYRNFKAPGKRFKFKSSVGIGSLAISQKGLVGFAGKREILSIPFDDKRMKLIAFSMSEKFLSLTFHPGLFNGAQEGEVEYRFFIPEVKKALAIIKSNGGSESIDKSLEQEVVAEVKQAQDKLNDSEWNNPDNWTGPNLCALYRSSKDSRLWVPKKIPSHGWTVNIGSAAGLIVLASLVATFLTVIGSVLCLLLLFPW